MATVISKAQNAFILGRQILDATLVANEAIYFIMRNNLDAILCKLDVKKVYDHVDWSLGNNYIGWIR